MFFYKRCKDGPCFLSMVLALIVCASCAYAGYSHKTTCDYYRGLYPTFDKWMAVSSGPDGSICTAGMDAKGFCKCECVSYAAEKAGISSNNGLSDAHNWDDRARQLNIPVSKVPTWGAVIQWNNKAGGVGHVGFVEWVDFNKDTGTISGLQYSDWNGRGDHDGPGGKYLRPSDSDYADADFIYFSLPETNRYQDGKGIGSVCLDAFPTYGYALCWEHASGSSETCEGAIRNYVIWDHERCSKPSDCPKKTVSKNLCPPKETYLGKPSSGRTKLLSYTSPSGSMMNWVGGFGGGPTNPDPKDGTPYPVPSDSDSERFSDGSNKVGFEYMKIGSRSSDKWEYDVVWREDQIPEKKDFRIKLKKKNGKWPSKKACVQIYFSHNKYFHRDDDAKIGSKECDTFDTGDDVESVYVENVYLPRSEMKPERNYYFFAYITDENGNLLDVSTRTTDDEYVKADITGLRFDTQTSVSHNAQSGVNTNATFQATVVVRNILDETKENVGLTVWFAGYAETVDLGKMSANSQKTLTFSFVAPSTAGTFDIVALSDPNSKIHETDSANNRSVAAITVVETYDLAVVDSWLSGYFLDIGSPVSVKSLIANNGGRPPQDVKVTADLIAQNQDEYPLGETTISSADIPKGVVLEVSIAGSVPKMEGEFVLRTCVIALGISETDTTNNCRFSAGPALSDPAPTPLDPAVQYIIDSEI